MSTTVKTVKQKWSDINKRVKLLKSQEGEEYYKMLEYVKIDLSHFIRENDLSELSTIQLLHLCGWVQSYRPMALHTFLIYCNPSHK